MKELDDMSLEELWHLFPIILKEHNSEYQIWYEGEKDNILSILGDKNICRISHIGSTSVIGLIAKPIVDILLELPFTYDIEAVARQFQDNGWNLMSKDNVRKTLDLNKGYTAKGFAERVYHLHIRPPGDWDELYFRDYLHEHPDIARQYEMLKIGLQKQFEHDRNAYTDAKSKFVNRYSQKAHEEFPGRYSV